MSTSAPAASATLDQWLSYLETLHKVAIDLELSRIRKVAQVLDIQTPFVTITVGGTNGKGSTCAMLESMLLAAGYKVGVYASPHLVRYNERIRLNGEQAADTDIISQFRKIDAARGDITLSYFEFSTLAALLLFQERAVDVAVLEVGLGGRLDAVNMVDADCAIITSVDIDHAQYLGDTREKIGWEKAHIFRPGRPAICADPIPPASIVEYAAQVGADLWLFGNDFNYSGDRQQWAYGGRSQRRAALGYPALRGANQLLNACAALAAIEALRGRLAVPQQAVREGLLQVNLPGRLQILPGNPVVILDVAHNPHAAAALGQNLDNMGRFGKTHAVIGMLADKDVEGVIEKIASRVDHWYCASVDGARGMAGDALAEHVRKVLAARAALAVPAVAPSPSVAPVSPAPAMVDDSFDGPGLAGHGSAATDTRSPGVRAVAPKQVAAGSATVSVFENPVQAFTEAQKRAAGDDRILVFGSFTTVGPVLQSLGR